MKNGKLTACVCFFLVLALAFACVPFSLSQSAVCEAAYSDAETAASYGGKDASSLWYYGTGNYDLSLLKTLISSWNLTSVTEPVVIAVVDTGCNTNHDIFSSTGTLYKNSTGTVIGYNSYVAATNASATSQELGNITDAASDRHGTAIAGIIAMTVNELGLSDYIKICPVKASFTDNTGSEGFKMTSIAEGVRWAVETAGAEVVNVSVASTETSSADWAANTAVKNTFFSASEKAVVVAAAGNNNKSSSELTVYPASYPGVLSVTGYKSDGSKNSNGNYGDYDVAAPGTSIYTTGVANSAYTSLTGTSMAAALVSVTAAVLSLRDKAAGETHGASVIAKHIRTSYTTYVSHTSGGTTYNIPKHSPVACVSTAYSDVYVEPRGIEISDENFASSITRGQGFEISLNSYLLPYGTTDPALDGSINWYLIEVLTRTEDENGATLTTPVEYEGEKTLIGSGRKLNYKPDLGGTYILRAEYVYGAATFSADRRFTLNYVPYSAIANGTAVVLSSEFAASAPRNAATVFATDELTFALTYSDCTDPTVETKWFVNGEYAASGATFTFSSRKAGVYTVTAQYGEYSKVGKTFTVTVESSVGRPQSIISLSVAGAAILATLAVSIVLAVRKRKESRLEK